MTKLEFQHPDNHFGNLPSYFDKMIYEICETESIALQWVSNFWVAILEREEHTHFIMGRKFDLNDYAAGLIADDKYSTYEILSRNNLPVIEHQLIYALGDPNLCAEGYNSLERIEKYLAEHDNSIVIKPNNGTLGRNVLQITDRSQLPSGLEQVFSQSFSGSMCPFYEIETEYRVVVLDEESRLVYCKERGNDWRFNLEYGAKAMKVTDQAKLGSLTEIAVAAAKAINLRFCTVDIIKTANGKLLIMEVNSGVMIEHFLEQNPDEYDVVKSIYHDAVRKMFA